MAAADAHKFVTDQNLKDAVARVVADAPELSTAQRDAVRMILLSANATRPEKVNA